MEAKRKMSVISWLKGVLSRLFDTQDIADKMQTELPAEKDMREAVTLWAECYRNVPPWTVAESNIRSLNLPYSIAHEMARLVTLEMQSKLTGSARAEYLSEAYDKAIADAPVWVEYGCALGSVFLKPYVSGGKIFTDYVQADAAVVTSYDGSGGITGCIFADRITKGRRYYTRLEKHVLSGYDYIVTNKAYVSDNAAYIGREIPLGTVTEWADIAPEAAFTGIKRPLFAYLGMPGANIIDRRSPLGVSVFNPALPTIEEADRQFTRSIWEFEGSELAVYADVTAVQRNSDGSDSMPRFDRRLIKTLDFNKDEAFEVFSPVIREEAQRNGLNQLLRQAERQCGLAFGTLSEISETDKTATEIKASKQRSYATVSAIQSRVRKALTEYAEVLDILCDIYCLAPKGKTEQSFDFDDSLVTDSESEQKIWLQEVSAGLMSPVEYRMKRYGETEEQAAEALPESFGDE